VFDAIHPDTVIASVHLTVNNLDRSISFYEQKLGFKTHRRAGGTAFLGAGETDLLILTEVPGARPARGTTGLYHFAILVPSRRALALSLHHLAETKTQLQGFADHLVSEAIYLSDPDGNGIEIYRDLPRGEWPHDSRGSLTMATNPLDIDTLLAEVDLADGKWAGLPPQTVVGHVHLYVAHIPQAIEFYSGLLGFDLVMRYGPSAAFLSAGGYHHHIGINTWAGVGAPPPPPDATGLRWFAIRLPNVVARDKIIRRLRGAGVKLEERREGILLHDSSQNGIMLQVQQH